MRSAPITRPRTSCSRPPRPRRRSRLRQRWPPSVRLAADYGSIGPTRGVDALGDVRRDGQRARSRIFQAGPRARPDPAWRTPRSNRPARSSADLEARIEFEVRAAFLDLRAADERVRVARSAADLAEPADDAGPGSLLGRRRQPRRGRPGPGGRRDGEREPDCQPVRAQPGQGRARARPRRWRKTPRSASSEDSSNGPIMNMGPPCGTVLRRGARQSSSSPRRRGVVAGTREGGKPPTTPRSTATSRRSPRVSAAPCSRSTSSTTRRSTPARCSSRSTRGTTRSRSRAPRPISPTRRPRCAAARDGHSDRRDHHGSSQLTTATAAVERSAPGLVIAGKDVDAARSRLAAAQARVREAQAERDPRRPRPRSHEAADRQGRDLAAAVRRRGRRAERRGRRRRREGARRRERAGRDGGRKPREPRRVEATRQAQADLRSAGTAPGAGRGDSRARRRPPRPAWPRRRPRSQQAEAQPRLHHGRARRPPASSAGSPSRSVRSSRPASR